MASLGAYEGAEYTGTPPLDFHSYYARMSAHYMKYGQCHVGNTATTVSHEITLMTIWIQTPGEVSDRLLYTFEGIFPVAGCLRYHRDQYGEFDLFPGCELPGKNIRLVVQVGDDLIDLKLCLFRNTCTIMDHPVYRCQ